MTGMEIANASLLDEGTAAAEAMALLFDVRTREQKKNNVSKFFVSEEILPQTLSILETRSTPLNIELVVGNHETFDFSSRLFRSDFTISWKIWSSIMTILNLLQKRQKMILK